MIALFLTSGILLGSLVVAYFVVTSNGSSWNPLRWAQERRDEESRARLAHISQMEHELGYRPCSDDACRPCNGVPTGRGVGRGHPIWDDPSLPAPPPMDLTALTKKAYDGQVRNAMYPLYKYGRTSGGGPR